jgi:3-hydroxyacyl-CoA dehydrogenase
MELAENQAPVQVIQRVAVIGAGVIGASWAAFFLARGLDVTVFDPAPESADRLDAALAQIWPSLQAAGLAPGASLARLRFCASLEDALRDAQFVQENGPEREDLKLELFRRMDSLLDADIIIASSSSGLLMSDVQSACRFPGRVVLGHPFNPPHLIPLVEVVGGQATSADTVQRTMAFYREIGKRPIHPAKEMKGHIANRLQAALWREAFYLVSIGAASVADIDDAIRYGPGLRWAVMGPFLNLHLSGGAGGMAHLLEHLGGPIEDWWDDLGAPVLTADLKQRVIDGVSTALEHRDEAALAAQRDAVILQLLRLRAQALPDC